mmetsp:Transcript_100736/g.158831  ORF Transcript_100736/g.158831 Transcript_100736/m.158831 type:complete len:129 (-) Transcript_100736:642-1028(-)
MLKPSPGDGSSNFLYCKSNTYEKSTYARGFTRSEIVLTSPVDTMKANLKQIDCSHRSSLHCTSQIHLSPPPCEGKRNCPSTVQKQVQTESGFPSCIRTKTLATTLLPSFRSIPLQDARQCARRSPSNQ